jgi:hypothetical protein
MRRLLRARTFVTAKNFPVALLGAGSGVLYGDKVGGRGIRWYSSFFVISNTLKRLKSVLDFIDGINNALTA